MNPQKIIAVHQPNFIPWLGYFYKMKNADAFVLLNNVEYQSGNASSITNRTKIKTAQGELMISVPVKKSDLNLINQIQIDSNQLWQKKILKSLQLNYSKAPYFAKYYSDIERLLLGSYSSLAHLNIEIIKQCAIWLDIETPIYISSEMNIIGSDKNERLIEICKILEGTIYLSGNGAKKYNDEYRFNAVGIALHYTAYQPSVYPQLFKEFIPGLSCIDALFNCGDDTAKMI